MKIFLLLLSIFLTTGCLVTEKDYKNSKNSDNHCNENDDCEFDEICRDNLCQGAEDCISCTALPHGESICFHGLCMVQYCEDGYHNANGLFQDGCEYECNYSGDEICDSIDNNCDGIIDENFNLNSDPDNCGYCNNKCPQYNHTTPVCSSGTCYFQCDEGWFDTDTVPDNGCESDYCEITNDGSEICDLRDNNCDGVVDEGIDKSSPESCGALCEVCNFPNAVSYCVAGTCQMGQCDEGCYDLNGDNSDGCEYCCTPTSPPEEVCDNVDNDCNGLIDEGLTCSCPDGMTLIDSLFCIDIYEASRPDATYSNPGTDSSTPLSRPQVVPWSGVSLQDASDACMRADKRLCTTTEWLKVCEGQNQRIYSYGDQYDPEICNGIDSFCKCGPGETCEDATPCPFAHCYQACGAWFGLEPTGSFPNCTNNYHVFDLTGNLWERLQGGTAKGGAYNCNDSEALHKCSYVANWGTEARNNFGFRCCCTGSSCPQ